MVSYFFWVPLLVLVMKANAIVNGRITVLVVYLGWAILPDWLLFQMGIFYFPSR